MMLISGWLMLLHVRLTAPDAQHCVERVYLGSFVKPGRIP
jgi:hypothetical protein